MTFHVFSHQSPLYLDIAVQFSGGGFEKLVFYQFGFVNPVPNTQPCGLGFYMGGAEGVYFPRDILHVVVPLLQPVQHG